jgi:hypothetical protein
MTKYPGPLTGPDFGRQVSRWSTSPFRATISGEVNSNYYGTLGVANLKSRVVDVIFSVSTCGEDATAPTATIDVYINGTTIFSTLPVLAHVAGESAQFKTTHSEAADTGITAHVIDDAANTLNIGDILSWKLAYSGNASPTKKMANPTIIVEVDPVTP